MSAGPTPTYHTSYHLRCRLHVVTVPSRPALPPPPADQAVQARPAVLLVFGEHAREVITSELALWLARLLVGEVSELLQWQELAQVRTPCGAQWGQGPFNRFVRGGSAVGTARKMV